MNNNKLYSFLLASVVSIAFLSCDDNGVNDYKPERPIGGYTSTSEIAPTNLVSYFSFNGNVADSLNNIPNGTATATSFADGLKGQCLQGATNGLVTYETPTNKITGLKSFTVTLWINTQKHGGGAQCIFMLPRTDDFWGNMFLLIEGNEGPSDSMQVKFNFAGQWIDLGGDNRLPHMYGSWKHLAFSYNSTTSKFYVYQNGVKVSLPASFTDRKDGDNPLGSNFDLNNHVSKFVIGAYQQHLGSPWNAPDGWMLHYTGKLDEFRIYNKALEDGDINSIYKLEQLGR